MLKNGRRFGAMAACAGIALASTQASATQYEMCFDETAALSAEIHQFQTMLMVGSLKCRSLDPSSLRRYGDFVTSRNGDLAVHTDKVRGAFNQRYGPAAGTRMFRLYETSLGNSFSRIDMTPATCQDLGTYARMAERANHADIATISNLAVNRAIPLCPAGGMESSDAYYAPEPMPAVIDPPAPSIERAVAAPRPGPHEADFEVVEAAPVVPIADETSPSVMAVAQKPQPAAEPAQNESDARLAQAIEALDNAANALREMRTDIDR